MSIRREGPVTKRLLRLLREHKGADATRVGPMDEPILPGAVLTRRRAVALFESALQSRLQDLLARRLKDQGRTFYTIGSAGHESNAIFGELLRPTDPAFLHYRSGAFVAARARHGRAETPIFDAMLSFCASAEDPVSGGRHKVLGNHRLNIPPQTSTIASHLPKAAGYAYALARMARLGVTGKVPADSIVYCSFGDASTNHATAQAGFNATAAAILHRQPCPIMFVCEDNGIGISVRTPSDYIQRMFKRREGLRYFYADGRDLAETYATAQEAVDWCRRTRRAAFFHLRTVRLMGHAGTDVETVYLSAEEQEVNERRDPLLQWADLILKSGATTPAQALALYEDTEERMQRAADEASRRRHLESTEQITEPLQPPDPESLEIRVAGKGRRLEKFGGSLPEDDQRPRHMAFRLAQALRDLMAAYPEMFIFGEDVAKKGGVYHVTDGIYEAFRAGRIFNTILDETTILGLAQGMSQAGCLTVPEIRYLAYVHNAIDQIRGEAASLKFFSNGRCRNGMVIRIAGLAYQKGFGGHFHNDNSIGALLEIPGLIIAVPSRADDAVGMLRTCTAAADQHGEVCVFLEPIALYMQKDLHEPGDGLWQFAYPRPDEITRLGEVRAYGVDSGDTLTIVSYGNGLHMSLRVQKLLRDEGIAARVIDLRWLSPLPIDAVVEHVAATGRCLIVDECRATMGGPSPMLLTELCQAPELRGARLRRVAAVDSYVPLGPAANLVLVQIEDIHRAAVELCAEQVS